jgi:beta-glucuronidase
MIHREPHDHAAAIAASRRRSGPKRDRERASAGESSVGAGARVPALSRVAHALAICLALMLGLSAAAHAASTGPAAGAVGPAPTPPTRGALYRDGQTNRYLLGGAWLFRADPAGVGIAHGYWRDRSATGGWAPVTVPNSYNAGNLSSASMKGSVGWYRRDFTVPSGAFASYVPRGFRAWIVRFESVNYRATVWLNGRQIGTHAGAFLPFELTLPNIRAGVNRLVVRVDDRRGGGDLPPGPGGGWWNYGGLLREVYLRPVARADLSQVQIRPVLACATCAVQIQEQVLVRNLTSAPQAVTLTGLYGGARLAFGQATIASRATWTATAVATIARPHLWSIDDPFLYRATLRLADAAGRTLGGYVSFSGVRTITVVAGHLELNGRLLSLRGVNIHEQSASTGAALSPTQLSALVGWARELGSTVLRSHYPLNPEIEELADRDGILIWSEIPVYQVNVSYLSRPGWLARAHEFLRQDILTNQNHPSVMLWSIANELRTPAPGAEARYVAGAAALARALDPTRPVGMAVSSWPGVACQPAYAPLDVVGYNEYFGWFDAGGGTNDDRSSLGPYLDTLRSCYPGKAMFVTEFGFEANRNGPVEERGTYQFQTDTTAFHLGAFASKSYLSGAIYFALQDFAARPGWGGGNPFPDPPFVQKGLVDLQGDFKPAFATVAGIYRSTVQIGAAPALSPNRPGAVKAGTEQRRPPTKAPAEPGTPTTR